MAFNTIWRVKPRPGTQLKAFVIDRLRSFGLVVAIGFLLLVSLTVSAALAALNTWLASLSPTNTTLWIIVNALVSMAVTTGLFAILFRFVPDVRLRWRDVTTGAAVTALLFTIGQQVIGWYLGQSTVASSYGAAGSVMGVAVMGLLLVPDRAVRRRVHAGVGGEARGEGEAGGVCGEGSGGGACEVGIRRSPVMHAAPLAHFEG